MPASLPPSFPPLPICLLPLTLDLGDLKAIALSVKLELYMKAGNGQYSGT